MMPSSALEKQAKKEKTTTIIMVIFISFCLFIGAYFYWKNDQKEVIQVAVNPERIILQQPNKPITIKNPSETLGIFSCTDNQTGKIIFADKCPTGMTAKLIETENKNTGVGTYKRQNDQQVREQRSPEIIVIRNFEKDVRACHNYYRSKIEVLERRSDYPKNHWLAEEINKLNSKRDQCIRAAKAGEKYPPVLK